MSRSARRRRRKARERPAAVTRRANASPPISRRLVVEMRLIPWLIAIAFCVGAWFGLDYGLGERSLANDSKTWPITAGIVIAAEIDMSAGRYSAHYQPHVTYVYTVNGESYAGHVPRAGGYSFGSETVADYLLAQYPVGSTVSVHYDPDEPSRAVLEPGGDAGWRLFAGAGVVSGIIGVVLLIRTAWDEWLRVTYERAERRQALAAPDSP